MQSMKDAAASAKAGMEKAKASMQEKVDQMKTRDPNEKEMARERKEERQEDAELRKQEARHHNATAGHAGGGGIDGTGYTTAGYNRGDTGGYGGTGGHDNRGYPTAGSGYDTGRQDDLSSMGFGGDIGGAYGTTGNQDFPSAAPNNAGTRRSTRGGTQDDPYYRSY
ncbi:hypothetical protein Golax_012285 [Gossypium laxum]|uniref:Uncharacterized protein n=1 Tax=Gossypium laxum TaxID=34288 RepID=A0A7J8ZNR0_9ROSI|nr:hypothetical protein [Gossypium laxum]